MPALVLLLSAFFLFKFLYRLRRSPDTQPDRTYLIPFLCGFSVFMLFGLHGASALKILIIITINYLISRYAGGSTIGPFFLWVFNALVLFANETYSGYRFASLHSSLEFMVWLFLLMCGLGLIRTPGQYPGCLSSMACHFQHDNAEIGLLWYGHPLGNQSRTSKGGELSIPRTGHTF